MEKEKIDYIICQICEMIHRKYKDNKNDWIELFNSIAEQRWCNLLMEEKT